MPRKLLLGSVPFRKVRISMIRIISDLCPGKSAGMKCRTEMLKRMKTLSSTPERSASSFQNRLRVVGRIGGGIWEILNVPRKAALPRFFRKDAFLVEIEDAFLVLAPIESLRTSFYVALIDGSANFHLALCEKCPKTDRWIFRSADSGKKLETTNVQILGEVLAFEEIFPEEDPC